MSEKIILVGGFSEIIELCKLCEKKIIGYFDISPNAGFQNIKYLGPDDTGHTQYNIFRDIPLIVSPDLPKDRKRIVENYKKLGYRFTTLISPKAIISESATIGEGVIIQSWVNISSNVVIGNFVKLNTMSNVMHDSIVGDYSTIAPNAVILGRVTIGQECYVGSNSTILPSIKADDSCTIGAGAVVTKNIESGVTVVGIPARAITT
jgi:sugar O-acyltransferase (sialic acid O-acetyltransferase NeuD family)